MDLRRKQDKGAERAAAAEREAAAAEEWRRNFSRAVRRYEWRQRIGWALLGLSVVMFLTHILEHTGDINLFSRKIEDWVIGFPMAGALLLIGAICLGQIHPAERK